MALTKSEIIELYTATFNRAADADGVAYWLTQELTQTEMANAFIASTEAAALYPSTQTNTEYVEAIYANLFGHAADAAGLAYWVGELDAGTTAKESMVVAVVNGALGADQTTLDNRTAVSTKYVDGNSNATDVSLASVTDDAATVTAANVTADAAIQAIIDAEANANQGVETVGKTIVFTNAIDALTGTSANDTFVGQVDAATTNTIVSADQVAGGTGTDTVKIYADAATQVNLPTMDSIETLWLTNLDEADNYNFATGAASATTIEIDSLEDIHGGAAARTYTIASTQTLVLDSVNDSTAGAESVDVSTTSTTLNLGIDGTFAGTTAAMGEIIVDSAGTAVTTLNIAFTGDASMIDFDSTGGATKIKTVTVTGDAKATLDIDALTAVTTFDASASSSALTVDLSNIANALTATGSTGNDTVSAIAAQNVTLDTGAGDDYVNVAATLTAADSITAGEGTDTIGMTVAGAAALDGGSTAEKAILAKVSGFEQLRLTDALSATVNAGNVGYNYVQLGAATAADNVISGLTSGATIEVRAGEDSANAATTITMTGATGAGTNDDTLNILLNDDLVVGDTGGGLNVVNFDVAGINKLNITAQDRTNTDAATEDAHGYIIDLEDNGSANSSANVNIITIDGTSAVSYAVEAGSTGLTTIDASASEGDMTITGAAFGGNQGLVITGGNGADTITGTGLADIIVGGADKDTITGGVGADVMTGGTEADTFVFANTATGTPSASAFDTIKDFEINSDIIDGGAALTISQSGTATVGTAAINAEGIASFNVADDTFAEKLTAVAAGVEVATATTANDIAIFEHDGSSYVYISDATAGVGATDVLIKLEGVTSLTDSTLTAGDLTIA